MKITLVVPVKNEVKTIKECVQSILNQTYRDFEVIFVDGGSKDGTYEFLEEVSRRKRRIKIIREPGLGPGSGRDLGFQSGKGEILAHIDGDNIVAKNYLELCIEKLRSASVAGVRPGLEFVYENGFLGEILKLRRRMLYGKEPFSSQYPTVYRREIYDMAGRLDPGLIIGEDYDLWIRMQRAAGELHQTFVIERDAVIYNRPKERTIAEILQHSAWYGRGLTPILLKHPGIGLKFVAEPVFYPVMTIVILIYMVYRLPIFLIFPLIFTLRWGIFVLRRLDKVRDFRELVLALGLIPLIRVVESWGSLLGLLKYLTNELGKMLR